MSREGNVWRLVFFKSLRINEYMKRKLKKYFGNGIFFGNKWEGENIECLTRRRLEGMEFWRSTVRLGKY